MLRTTTILEENNSNYIKAISPDVSLTGTRFRLVKFYIHSLISKFEYNYLRGKFRLDFNEPAQHYVHHKKDVKQTTWI